VYLVFVLLLILVLPAGSIVIEHFAFHSSMTWIELTARWYVFWSVGVRLALAGLRQLFEPSFTSEAIFGLEGWEMFPLIRELGAMNLALGVAGFLSIFYPNFTLPVAVIGAVFSGICGLRHATAKRASLYELVSMISNLFVFLIFVTYLLSLAIA
jgi:hypothetical protein